MQVPHYNKYLYEEFCICELFAKFRKVFGDACLFAEYNRTVVNSVVS